MILLQLNDITKSFDGDDIFNNVDLEVKTGNVSVLLDVTELVNLH